MTFKANDIEQYPYLVYTDNAGNVYDPNGGGGGGGGEPSDESCIAASFFAGDIALEKDPIEDYYLIDGDPFTSIIICNPTMNQTAHHIIVEGASDGNKYGMPVQWICNICYGGSKESDPETEIEFDGSETLTAYRVNMISGEKQAIELVCTYGEYLDDPAWYFTIPPMEENSDLLCVCIDFGS